MDRPDDEIAFPCFRGKNNLQDWITPGGAFAPAAGRYHIFVNYGCGWCHQCMLVWAVKGLQKVVSISHTGLKTVGQRGTENYTGWLIPEDPTENGFTSAYDVYNKARDYGRKQLTTPMLFDKESKKVVSNDPAQILLMLNGLFNEWSENKIDLYPEQLRQEIENVNAVVYPGINDGVYRCWFAPNDEACAEGYTGVRNALKWVDAKLQSSEYLCGSQLTLADLRAFPHIFRFDVIYHKLMLREPRGEYIKDAHPAIVSWMQRLFGEASIQSVCDLQVATRFYLNDPVTDEECDKLYTDLKLPWMPSIEELQLKRQQEALPAASMSQYFSRPAAM